MERREERPREDDGTLDRGLQRVLIRIRGRHASTLPLRDGETTLLTESSSPFGSAGTAVLATDASKGSVTILPPSFAAHVARKSPLGGLTFARIERVGDPAEQPSV